MPLDEGGHPIVTSDRPEPAGTETMFTDTKRYRVDTNSAPRLGFLSECSAHTSSILKARVIQDTKQGIADTIGSIKKLVGRCGGISSACRIVLGVGALREQVSTRGVL